MDAPIRTRIRARVLRRTLTKSELWLWVRIRGSPRAKFRRQNPVGPYILDFYCAAARLAVEVDGGVHRDPAQVEHDERREAWLKSQAIRVVRLPSREVEDYPDQAAERVLALAETISARF